MQSQRLDKILASQGLGSRREVSALIRRGGVTVDGAECRDPARHVDAQSAHIELDGKNLLYRSHVYLMMNKPVGVLSAARDPKQPTVIELIPPPLRRRGLFPAGRLDKDTEGLLIITDDGGFAHRFLSPKKEIFKVYEAELDGGVTQGDMEAFRKGIVLEDGTVCRPAQLSVPKENPGNIVHVALCEGKFHQVKRMLHEVGRVVVHLTRIKIGRLPLDPALESGACREMTEEEIGQIFQ